MKDCLLTTTTTTAAAHCRERTRKTPLAKEQQQNFTAKKTHYAIEKKLKCSHSYTIAWSVLS